jgi:serine O-acetyltransferase
MPSRVVEKMKGQLSRKLRDSLSEKFKVNYIKSDLFRYYGKCHLKTFIGALVLEPRFSFLFWLRLAQSSDPLVAWAGGIVHGWKSRKYGVDIPSEVAIGYGLYIGHLMCIVLNPSVTIGDNCNLSQFTTIGSNHNNAACIGSNVYIGPHVCIVENVKIGDNCIIGAGTVVVKDVPPNTTVVGVPARVVGPNKHQEYIQNQWRCR